MVMIRNIKKSDLGRVCTFLRSNNQVVSMSYLERVCSENNGLSLMIERKGINGVVICKKTADLLEIINWEAKDNELFNEVFIKARAHGFNKLVTAEKESSKNRIKRLEKIGFESVQTHEGLFHGEKAVMMIKELR